jgi:hypothetical protein
VEGKYRSRLSYLYVKLYRFFIRSVIRSFVSWTPLTEVREGYTVIVGCVQRLPELLFANLHCLARQERKSLVEILLVLDGAGPEGIDARIAEALPGIPHRVLRWSGWQRFVTGVFRWPWINAWLSWSIAIREIRSRHVLIQDLDALLMRTDFLERRYAAIRDLNVPYLGVRWYEGNGILPEAQLVTTFQMMFDGEFVRKTFTPLHLFNHVTMYRGRSVDFDTFLHAESIAGERRMIPTDLDDFVHPSQMICQWAFHMNGDPRLPATTHNLMLLPYFMYLGGESETLPRLTREMSDRMGDDVTLFDRPLRIRELTPEHVAWLEKQAGQVERCLHGIVRPEIRGYFDALRTSSGARRQGASARSGGSPGTRRRPRE